MMSVSSISTEKIKSILETVMDPEVPVISVIDLGIIREIKLENDIIDIVITPTYTGCPAMDVISMNIRLALIEHGFPPIKISSVLSPAWTTDWMTEKGKQKLKEYGIAPPNPRQIVCDTSHFATEEAVQCPHCHSWHTKRISEFGSTACKSLYVCNECLEPFDYFKCH